MLRGAALPLRSSFRPWAGVRKTTGPLVFRRDFGDGSNNHLKEFKSTRNLRPLRSVLYTPGNRRSAIDKARQLKADALILDLEDAVAPHMKAEARQTVMEEVSQGGFGFRTVTVRINSLDSQWGEDDLSSVVSLGLDAVVVPKVSCADDVLSVVGRLEELRAPRSLELWAMIETPLGVLNAKEIARSHPRLKVLVAGTSDLSKELRCSNTMPDRLPLLPSLSMIILAGRSYGLKVLDGVQLDIHDLESFHDVCQQGRDLGFDGKTIIHPKTISITNDVFSPSSKEVEHAKKVIQAWEDAISSDAGVAVLDGKLIENLHVDLARDTLSMHTAIIEMDRGAFNEN